MSNLLFNTAKRDFANAVHDWDDMVGKTYKVALIGTTYTPDPDHEFMSSLSAHEVSGVGYTPGFASPSRKALASRVVVADLANDRAELDAADVSWNAISVGTIKGAVIYLQGTSDADSRVVAWVDSGFPIVTDGNDLAIAWNAEGIIQLQ